MSLSYNSSGILQYDFVSGIKNPPRKSNAAYDAGTLVKGVSGKHTVSTAVTALTQLDNLNGILVNDVLADVAAGFVANPSQGITSDASLGREYWSATQALGVGQFRISTNLIDVTTTGVALAADVTLRWTGAGGAEKWTTTATTGDIILAIVESVANGQALCRLCTPHVRA